MNNTSKYVYTCLYDPLDRVLMATKNKKAYFFKKRVLDTPQSLADKGGELPALPGGSIENKNENRLTKPIIIHEALREFTEETGYELNKMTTYNPKETICVNFTYTKEKKQQIVYYVVYIKTHEFENARWEIDNCLDQGKSVANSIATTPIQIKTPFQAQKLFQELKTKFPLCPQDNELEKTEVINLNSDDKKINQLKGSDATDWFYFALDFLRQSKQDPSSNSLEWTLLDPERVVTSIIVEEVS